MKRSKVLWGIKLFVALALLFVLYHELNKGDQIILAFRDANWVNVGLCLLVLPLNFAVQWLKWRYVLKTRYPEMNNKAPFQSLLFGSTLGLITPGNLGELARGLFFEGYDRLIITGLNIIDKLFGMLIFITLGILAVNYLMFAHFSWPAYIIWPVAVISLLFIVFLWLIALNPQAVRSFLYGINTMLPAREKIKQIISCLDNFHRRQSLVMAGISLIWFIVIFIQYHLLILAFTNVAWWKSLVAVAAVLFTKVVLPVSFGDLGIREGASVFYYLLFGVPKAAAFNASILIFVINFLIPAISGSYFVFRLRWQNAENQDKDK
ncbi:MAG: hypothetical protein Kow0037_14070 [Calditrichia bacterium]